jgi:hypothetical protein
MLPSRDSSQSLRCGYPLRISRKIRHHRQLMRISALRVSEVEPHLEAIAISLSPGVNHKQEMNFAGCGGEPIVGRVGHDRFATLTAEEFASLCEAAKGVTDRAIPDDHRKRLIYLNFIADRCGRIDLTEPGRIKLASDR